MIICRLICPKIPNDDVNNNSFVTSVLSCVMGLVALRSSNYFLLSCLCLFDTFLAS
jgi:hypothetical protein